MDREAITGDDSRQSYQTTGIPILDSALGGGLPSGSVVYIYADVLSMAELLLHQFTQSRSSYYFSTNRRAEYVARDIRGFGLKTEDITFIDVNGEFYESYHREKIDPKVVYPNMLEFTEYHLNKILLNSSIKDVNIIFDSFSFYLNMNVNPELIKRLFCKIYDITKKLNCLTFLYGYKSAHPNNLENDILSSCDAVLEVDIEKTSFGIASKLLVPRIRGGVPITETIRFKVMGGIQLETTSEIA